MDAVAASQATRLHLLRMVTGSPFFSRTSLGLNANRFAAMSTTRGSWDRATGATPSNAIAKSPTCAQLPKFYALRQHLATPSWSPEMGLWRYDERLTTVAAASRASPVAYRSSP